MTHPAVTNGAYDVAHIRKDFPILAMEVYGKPLIYLDNAASAQKPQSVLDRIQTAYTSEYANVHRGLHYLANAATEAYEGAREKVRAFINAERHEEIIFTRNATEAYNLVASSMGWCTALCAPSSSTGTPCAWAMRTISRAGVTVPSTFDMWVIATILVRGVRSFSNSSIRKLPSSSTGAHLITAPWRSRRKCQGTMFE